MPDFQCYESKRRSIGCLTSLGRSVGLSPLGGPDKLIRQETLSLRCAAAALAPRLSTFPKSRVVFGGGGGPLFVLDFLEREGEWRMGNAERSNDRLSLMSSYDAKDVPPL